MKRLNPSRRGSALLVVLGMMSFIVVSAVAFSAYMRYARLPSSYLRRTSATRLLAKAALSEAIDLIDRSIGNNPYPGVGAKQYSIDGDNRNFNQWQDRVYVGDEVNDLPAPDETIATLNMEALAYIPPPFINEARYWSRRSTAATWKQMGFDAGRFAFTAIDLSDCFDVNRLAANVGRDSSDMGRITLAHCFKTPNNSSAPVTAAAWDEFIKEYNTSDLPLVSVADLNLAANAYGVSGLKLPFCDYLNQNTNAKFVKNDSGAEADFMKSLTFVTDGYFPVTNSTQQVLNLEKPTDQPFFGLKVASNDRDNANDDTIEEIIMDGSSKFINKYLGPMDQIALYDYLDKDSVPLSLALPTTECVPMITGIGLSGECNILFEKGASQEYDDPNATQDPATGNPSTAYRVTVARVILKGDLMLSAGVVFPFKGERGADASFKAQAAMTVTMVPAGSESKLRVGSAKSPAVITKGDWKNSQVTETINKYGNEKYRGSVITLQSAQQNVPVKSSIEKEEDALCGQKDFEFSFEQPLEGDFPQAIQGVALEERQLRGSVRIIEKINRQTKAVIGNPIVQNCIEVSNAGLNAPVEMDDTTKYVPVIQAWVRIVDGNGKTVDLVPACANDDETPWTELPEIASCTKAYPLVRFYPEDAEACSISKPMFADISALPDDLAVTWRNELYLADDPRFNFAPENLKTVAKFNTPIPTAWMSEQRSKNRDGDIFMLTSDAGYLQSKYELTNLPVVDGSLIKRSATQTGVYDGGYNGNARTDFASTPANNAMWTTYSQFRHNGRVGDLDDIVLETGTKGFRINPYTKDPNIMLAALANTPLGWNEASTNKTGRASDFTTITLSDGKTKRDAIKLDAALTYSDDENTHEKLKELAKELVTRFSAAQGGGDAWEDAFEDLGWNVDGEIGGVDFSGGLPLHSVDKKFLYGYWRECFANRQQLFLIVVRAEPAMMGGGGLGQTPPQLGARAVALVWRDPTPTREDVNGQPRPHRTRVLFYRQLD